MELNNSPDTYYKYNPFRYGSVEGRTLTKIANIKSGDRMMIGNKEGELVLANEKLVDKTPFIKIYHAAIMDLVRTLTIGGWRMLGYTMHNLKYGWEIVEVNIAEYMDVVGVSQKTAYNDLHDAIVGRVLARKEGSTNMYWINPDYIFSGERRFLASKRSEKNIPVIAIEAVQESKVTS